jgi:hypothetical protein
LKDHIANIAGGLVYVGFFVVALRVLTGTAGNSSAQPKHALVAYFLSLTGSRSSARRFLSGFS